jgi:hypothetical protein
MADISIVNGGYNADKPTYNWGGTILYHGFCEISQDFVVPFHGVEKPAPGGASAGRQTAGERTFTWWLIPLSKWVITPVINGISRVNPLIIGVYNSLTKWDEPLSTLR